MVGGSSEQQRIHLPAIFSNGAIEDGCGNSVYI
jgi:hypothetical protein